MPTEGRGEKVSGHQEGKDREPGHSHYSSVSNEILGFMRLFQIEKGKFPDGGSAQRGGEFWSRVLDQGLEPD